VGCLNQTVAPVAARVPLIFGEVGEDYEGSSCQPTNVAQFLPWADAHGVGYAAWTWDVWDGCGSLIRSYGGTPANAYGAWIRAYYAGVAASDRQR
jgi:hypothetical protein